MNNLNMRRTLRMASGGEVSPWSFKGMAQNVSKAFTTTPEEAAKAQALSDYKARAVAERAAAAAPVATQVRETAAPMGSQSVMAQREKAAGLREGGEPPVMRNAHKGGWVPGEGEGDKTRALLEKDEFVVSRDMFDAQPELRQHLRDLRGNVLASQGKTPAQADADQIKHGVLHAVTAADLSDPSSRFRNPSLAPSAPNTIQPEAISANNLRLKNAAAKEIRLANAAIPAGPTTTLGAAAPNNGIKWAPNIPDPIQATTSLGAAPPAPPPAGSAPAAAPAAAAPVAAPAPQPGRFDRLRASVNQMGTNAGEAYKFATTGLSPGSEPVAPKPAFVPTPAPEGAGRISKLTNSASNLTGRVSSAMPTAAGVARGSLGVVAKAAPVVAAGMAAKNVGEVAMDPNATKIDVGTQLAEEGGKWGTAGLGAAALAPLGLAGGIAAPVTVPLAAAAGGVAGYFGGDAAIKGLRMGVNKVFGTNMDTSSPIERTQARNAAAAAAAAPTPKAAAPAAPNPTLREPAIYADNSAEVEKRKAQAQANAQANAQAQAQSFAHAQSENARIAKWHADGDKARDVAMKEQLARFSEPSKADALLANNNNRNSEPEFDPNSVSFVDLIQHNVARKQRDRSRGLDIQQEDNQMRNAATLRGQDVQSRGQDMSYDSSLRGHDVQARGQDMTQASTLRGQDVTREGHQMELEGRMAPIRMAQAQAAQFQKVMAEASKRGVNPVELATQSGVSLDVIKRIQDHQSTEQANGDARTKSMAAPFDGKFNDVVDGKSVVDKESEARATEILREMTKGQNWTPDQIAEQSNNVINQVKLIKAMRESQLRENGSFLNAIGLRKDEPLPSDIPSAEDVGGMSPAGTVDFWDGMRHGHGVTAGDHVVGGYRLRADTDSAAIKHWNNVAAQRAAKKAQLRTN